MEPQNNLPAISKRSLAPRPSLNRNRIRGMARTILDLGELCTMQWTHNCTCWLKVSFVFSSVHNIR